MGLAQTCKINMKRTLMNENVIYRLRYPISILIAIILSVSLKNANSLNYFIAHVMIPIASFVIILFIIDVSVRNTLSHDDLKRGERKCDEMNLEFINKNKESFTEYMDNHEDDDNSSTDYTNILGENDNNAENDNNVESFTEYMSNHNGEEDHSSMEYTNTHEENDNNVESFTEYMSNHNGEENDNNGEENDNNVESFTEYEQINTNKDLPVENSITNNNVQNMSDYIEHDRKPHENTINENKIKEIIPDDETSNEIPKNNLVVNSKNLDRYATENINIMNINRNTYTDKLKDEICTKEKCCLLSEDKCSPICSGLTNNCGLVAPIPGPQWQVQKAKAVQNRLKKGIYTADSCVINQ